MPHSSNSPNTRDRDRRWEWYSTDESFEQRKISVLAVFETLFSVGVAIFVAVYLESASYIAATILIAPFLLLRTPESIQTGVQWFYLYAVFIDKPTWWIYERVSSLWHSPLNALTKRMGHFAWLIMAIWSIILGPISTLAISLPWILGVPTSIFVKFSATVYCFFKRPIYSISHVPSNWNTLALCTDVFRPPEFVPGYNEFAPSAGYSSAGADFLKLSEALAMLKLMYSSTQEGYTSKSGLEKLTNLPSTIVAHMLWTLFLLLPYMCTLYFPMIIYRFSLKSSSIIYAPLIYVIGGFRKNSNIALELDYIRNNPIQRWTLYYALLVVCVFTIAPLVFYSTLTEMRIFVEERYLWANEHWFRDLVSYWVMAYEWRPLYAARAISALLTIAIFLFADHEMRRRKFHQGIGDGAVTTWLIGMKIPRVICASYTLAFGLKTIVPYIQYIHLPQFVWEWWPE